MVGEGELYLIARAVRPNTTDALASFRPKLEELGPVDEEVSKAGVGVKLVYTVLEDSGDVVGVCVFEAPSEAIAFAISRDREAAGRLLDKVLPNGIPFEISVVYGVRVLDQQALERLREPKIREFIDLAKLRQVLGIEQMCDASLIIIDSGYVIVSKEGASKYRVFYSERFESCVQLVRIGYNTAAKLLWLLLYLGLWEVVRSRFSRELEKISTYLNSAVKRIEELTPGDLEELRELESELHRSTIVLTEMSNELDLLCTRGVREIEAFVKALREVVMPPLIELSEVGALEKFMEYVETSQGIVTSMVKVFTSDVEEFGKAVSRLLSLSRDLRNHIMALISIGQNEALVEITRQMLEMNKRMFEMNSTIARIDRYVKIAMIIAATLSAIYTALRILGAT